MFHFNPWNILTAITNFTAALPIWRSYKQKDYVTTALITFAAFASFSYHLIKNHKHGMGIEEHSKTFSAWMNLFDLFGVSLVLVRFSGMFLETYAKLPLTLYLKTGTLLFVLYYGQVDSSSAGLLRYVIFHNLWHIGSFIVMDEFIKIYYNGRFH